MVVILLCALLLFFHSISGTNIPFASHLCQHDDFPLFISNQIPHTIRLFLFLSTIIFHTPCRCFCFYQQSYPTHHAGVSVSCWPFCFFPSPIPSVVQWYVLHLIPFVSHLCQHDDVAVFISNHIPHTKLFRAGLSVSSPPPFHLWCSDTFYISSLLSLIFVSMMMLLFLSAIIFHTPSCFVLVFLFLPLPHSICGAVIHQSVALLTLQQARFCLSLSRVEGLVTFLQAQKDLMNFMYTKYLIDQINF